MRRIFALCLGFTFGVALLYMAFTLHFVRTKDDVLIVPKRNPSLEDTYVDVRDWGLTEWGEHPDLIYTLVDKGFEKYVRQPITNDIFRKLLPKKLFESVMDSKSDKSFD